MTVHCPTCHRDYAYADRTEAEQRLLTTQVRCGFCHNVFTVELQHLQDSDAERTT